MDDLQDLERKVVEKILNRLELNDVKVEDVPYSMPLFSSVANGEKNLGLDSVDGLELVVMIYEAWAIKVPANDMIKLTTVQGIADYIRLNRQ